MNDNTLAHKTHQSQQGALGIVADRGQSATHPENTLPAILAALRLGAASIRCDVRPTVDGHLVLMHDRSPLRTTNIDTVMPSSVGLPIEALRLAELSKLDAGGWKAPEFTSTPIPTLKDVLKRTRETSVRLIVELKSATIEADAYAQRVADIVTANDNVLVTSQDRDLLDRLAHHAPHLSRGLVTTGAPSRSDLAAFAEFFIDARAITHDLVRHIHRAGGTVTAWNLLDEHLRTKAVSAGSDALSLADVREPLPTLGVA